MAAPSWQESKRLGNAAYAEGRSADAVSDYTRCLGDDSLPTADRAIILCNRAAAYLKLDRNADAVEDCTACLTHTPGYAKALFRRAAAYEALKDLKEALRDYKAVLERDPSLADAAVGVRRCESALGLPSSLPPAGKGRAGGARAPARPAISEEDARSLAELQTRVRDVGKSKMRASEQRRAADQEKRRAELTLEQVTALPETKRLYTALGRAYVLAPRAAVTAGLRDESTKADKRSRVCTLTLEHLVKQEEEAVAAFKEAVAAAQRGAQRT